MAMRSRIFPIDRGQEPTGIDALLGEDLLQTLAEKLGWLKEQLLGSPSGFLGILDVLEFLGLRELLVYDKVWLFSVRKHLSKSAYPWAYGLAKADD